MKKIVLLCVSLFVGTLSASAWAIVFDKAALLVAAQNYNDKTKEFVVRYVGEDFTKPLCYLEELRKGGSLPESKEWHRLHLDENLQPAATDENDAYVQIEKALEVVRNHKQYNKSEVSHAIQTVMNLVIDMHNIGNVTLAAIPKSANDFQINTAKGTANGRPPHIFQDSWRNFWSHRFQQHHGAYSAQMYAEDLTIMFADKKAEYMSGTLRDWAVDVGKYTTSVYEVLERNNGDFLHATVQAHEPLYMSTVARAGFRIAALLNDNLK